MELMNFQKIVEITGGKTDCKEDFPVLGAQTDSRRVKNGDIYVAIIGAKVDGHNFIPGAAENGAVCALISHPVEESPIPVILVESTEEALRSIARFYLAEISPKTVAVTGSCGKTTTKEMLYQVFSSEYDTLKTEGNYNSVIGLPLTVTRLSYTNKAAVFEMGTGHKGEIATMAGVAAPDIAVITNIGTSHIEFFGSREAIANEKCDIFRAVKPGGAIIINADDDMLAKVIDDKSFISRKLTYGINNKADVFASNIGTFTEDEYFITEFDITYGDQTAHAMIHTLGIHNVYNALAAVAAGIADGIPLEKCASALKNFFPDDMRMKVFRCPDGVTVISDVYNSNPQAVKASLRVLNEIAKGRKIAILGDMLEQGSFSEEAHREIGVAAAASADFVLTRGDMAQFTASGAASGLPYKNIHSVLTNKEAIEFLSAFDFTSTDTFLVKGSRGMKMEEIVDYLLKKRYN